MHQARQCRDFEDIWGGAKVPYITHLLKSGGYGTRKFANVYTYNIKNTCGS